MHQPVLCALVRCILFPRMPFNNLYTKKASLPQMKEAQIVLQTHIHLCIWCSACVTWSPALTSILYHVKCQIWSGSLLLFWAGSIIENAVYLYSNRPVLSVTTDTNETTSESFRGVNFKLTCKDFPLLFLCFEQITPKLLLFLLAVQGQFTLTVDPSCSLFMAFYFLLTCLSFLNIQQQLPQQSVVCLVSDGRPKPVCISFSCWWPLYMD